MKLLDLFKQNMLDTKQYILSKLSELSSDGISGNAGTATKLESARTISLDGQAAGSASFDGSKDVSINVSSVKADTAVADNAGNNIQDTYIAHSIINTAVDADTLTNNHSYQIATTAMTNMPTTDYGSLVVYDNGTTVIQTFYPDTGDKLYLRARKGSSWTSWVFPDADNASTVNGHTVSSDVPAKAKFTDTTYENA